MSAAAYNDRVTRPSLADPNIYIYSDGLSSSAFVKGLVALGERSQNVVFSKLSDCVMETLDVPPKVVVFDVHLPSPLLNAHIERIRNSPECANSAIVVRAQELSEPQFLELMAYEVNHIGLAHGRSAPILHEVEELLRNTNRRTRVSSAVSGLRTKISSRVKPTDALQMPEPLLRKFEAHYGFRIKSNVASGQRGGSIWGYLPVDDSRVAIFAAYARGNILVARKQCQRVQSLVTDGKARGDSPALALAYIRQHMAGFVSDRQAVEMVFVVIDKIQKTGTLVCTREVARFAPATGGTLIQATDVAIGLDTDTMGSELSVSVQGPSALFLPLDLQPLGNLNGPAAGNRFLNDLEGRAGRERSWILISFADDETGGAAT